MFEPKGLRRRLGLNGLYQGLQDRGIPFLHSISNAEQITEHASQSVRQRGAVVLVSNSVSVLQLLLQEAKAQRVSKEIDSLSDRTGNL